MDCASPLALFKVSNETIYNLLDNGRVLAVWKNPGLHHEFRPRKCFFAGASAVCNLWAVSARILAVLILAGMLPGVQAQIAEAGALAKGGKWEVSVDYEPDVARNSVIDINNYSLPGAGAVIEAIRYIELNNAVVLTVTGLRTNDLYAVQVDELRTTDNLPIPELTIGFVATPMSWAAIGAQELGFPADTVITGTNNFDLVSGGAEMRDEYDESTFAYEQVTGDFDKKVRILSQEPSSVEARAGLMVREELDEGADRPLIPDDPEFGAFSRFIQVHANPAQTAYEEGGETVPANNTFQVLVRPMYGMTEYLEITNNVAPTGSNTWVRLRRVGEVFEAFRGNDGTNWTLLARYTFPTNDLNDLPLEKFAETAFIGPNYTPEVANIPESSGERRSFLAQFRGYGDTGFVPADPPTLRITKIANEVELEWGGGGTLQSTTNLATGLWIDLQGTSPVRAAPGKPYEFFRVRIP